MLAVILFHIFECAEFVCLKCKTGEAFLYLVRGPSITDRDPQNEHQNCVFGSLVL